MPGQAIQTRLNSDAAGADGVGVRPPLEHDASFIAEAGSRRRRLERLRRDEDGADLLQDSHHGDGPGSLPLPPRAGRAGPPFLPRCQESRHVNAVRAGNAEQNGERRVRAGALETAHVERLDADGLGGALLGPAAGVA